MLYDSQKSITFAPALGPDGGIGRRAGLKHQWGNPSRFDPGSGYKALKASPYNKAIPCNFYGGFFCFLTTRFVPTDKLACPSAGPRVFPPPLARGLKSENDKGMKCDLNTQSLKHQFGA